MHTSIAAARLVLLIHGRRKLFEKRSTLPELLFPLQFVCFPRGRYLHVHFKRDVFLGTEPKSTDMVYRLTLPDFGEVQPLFLA